MYFTLIKKANFTLIKINFLHYSLGEKRKSKRLGGYQASSSCFMAQILFQTGTNRHKYSSKDLQNYFSLKYNPVEVFALQESKKPCKMLEKLTISLLEFFGI